MSSRALREKRAAAWARACEFRHRDTKGEHLTDADLDAWQRAIDETESLSQALGDDRSADLRSAMLGGHSGIVRDTGPEAEAFRSYLRTGEDVELRALGATVGVAGGYTVPEGFRAKITETMKSFGGLRRLAEVITTDDGADLPWPTNDDTANQGTGELAENTPMGEQDMSFGGKTLGAYTYASGIVKVAMQLLQDTGVDLEAFLSRGLGRRIARRQAGRWITGTGASQPQGILTAGVVGKTTTGGQTTSIIYNDLVDLAASVDDAYLEDPAGNGVGWVMHQNVLAHLRKIRDDSGGAGLGRPLLQPDVPGNPPNTIFGFPVVTDNGMPSAITASSKPIAFGAFRLGYVIRTVRQIEVLRLVERYADALQHGFLAWERADGVVQDPSAFKLLAMAAA